MRVNHAFKLIYNCSNHEQPEIWLSCTMQLINLCLTNPDILLRRKLSKHKLYALYRVCKNKVEYQYFFHTIKYLYVKLAIKYLQLQMMDEALYIGLKTNL